LTTVTAGELKEKVKNRTYQAHPCTACTDLGASDIQTQPGFKAYKSLQPGGLIPQFFELSQGGGAV
jgi:hypothetical protein